VGNSKLGDLLKQAKDLGVPKVGDGRAGLGNVVMGRRHVHQRLLVQATCYSHSSPWAAVATMQGDCTYAVMDALCMMGAPAALHA
jgi:hypothetical protein